MRNSKLSLAVLALVIGASAVQAQTNNASITATASVQTPINVVGAQQLNFGNVFPGVNKTVAATDLTNAGRFDVTGQASTPVTLSFTLPASLTSGANTMPCCRLTRPTAPSPGVLQEHLPVPFAAQGCLLVVLAAPKKCATQSPTPRRFDCMQAPRQTR